jgi:hypothetical protein
MGKIIFLDGYDKVVDAETQTKLIFSTIIPLDLTENIGKTKMNESIIDDVVAIYNEQGIKSVKKYLLKNKYVTKAEVEIIMGALFQFYIINKLNKLIS